MKLEINLNDEPSFLNEIKTFIMNNVKGIARNEFEKQIKQIYAEKLKSALPSDVSINSIVEREMKSYIKELIASSLRKGNTYDGGKSELRIMIREEISTQVKEMISKLDI